MRTTWRGAHFGGSASEIKKKMIPTLQVLDTAKDLGLASLEAP